MATVLPFRGILYDPKKIGDLGLVATPPFDVISQKAQQAFYERHPRNMIRLILGTRRDTDSPEDNWNTRAAADFRLWMEDGTLVRDPAEALYLTAVDFRAQERSVTRWGVICRVGLEPFEKRVVLPHEKTFSQVKSERLDLRRACRANFSPIFSLYPDPGNAILGGLLTAVADRPPDSRFTAGDGMHHRLWRIVDPQVHRFVGDAMRDKPLFIADGHHRYETALNYREGLSARTPGFDARHPANYVMMYLSGMEDPGLIILPAHRMLKAVDEPVRSGFLEKAAACFDIVTISEDSDRAALGRLHTALAGAGPRSVIGACLKGRHGLAVLTLKAGTMDRLFTRELPPAIRHIDVTVLTRLIFMDLLGFDHQRLDNEKLIGYATEAADALAGVRSGEYDMAFILNPTRISQVREVAHEGLIMPRKATYFYPKVVVGQVIHSLVPDGDL